MIPGDYEDLVENHVQAVLDLIKAEPGLTAVTFEGDVTGDPERYVNVFHDTGFYEAHTMGDEPVDVTVSFTIHSVGLERWQALWASGRVFSRLIRARPVIPGRTCWPIAHSPGPPMRKDTDVVPNKFLAIDTFTLKSTPASKETP